MSKPEHLNSLGTLVRLRSTEVERLQAEAGQAGSDARALPGQPSTRWWRWPKAAAHPVQAGAGAGAELRRLQTGRVRAGRPPSHRPAPARGGHGGLAAQPGPGLEPARTARQGTGTAGEPRSRASRNARSASAKTTSPPSRGWPAGPPEPDHRQQSGAKHGKHDQRTDLRPDQHRAALADKATAAAKATLANQTTAAKATATALASLNSAINAFQASLTSLTGSNKTLLAQIGGAERHQLRQRHASGRAVAGTYEPLRRTAGHGRPDQDRTTTWPTAAATAAPCAWPWAAAPASTSTWPRRPATAR
jgi:hypothetical protein